MYVICKCVINFLGTPNNDSCCVYGLTPQEVRYLKVNIVLNCVIIYYVCMSIRYMYKLLFFYSYS